MLRLFVGLEIPASMIDALEHVRGGVEGARWQRDDQLHLTLAFIGEIPNKQLGEIVDTLSQIRFEPFDMAIKGVGCFGKPKKPKSLWAGIENKRPVAHLHEKITHALMQIGLDMETRKFTPHITLARFKRGTDARIGDWLSTNDCLTSSPETVSNFTLFSSQLTSESAHYAVEAQFGGFPVS
ncbi:RNA 2',3'-cyclic phosphodiesterase [Kordiimonas sp. SCSIO 12610]|uniref:RNA 2',3'-cyclic phosphodiesterase n=1 Tax=Kordiimonas sp. SCSIO 12610 TaxID=2829597 RepID=UPI00210B4B52|nr:RNA 2',3'-cyclic phosphodiesterase [Kordiimonas sp. SCSIO 12610]UTW55192.1 RNA 2',3'-cyclic phosphodiesterase [Kordiimonas sp. SCSIO 12610]